MSQNAVLRPFLIVEALSKDELLAVLGRAYSARRRDWLIFLVAYSHGLRVSEVVALTRDSFADGYLDCRRLKGSLRTHQPLIEHDNPLLSECRPVLDYIAQMHANQRVFPISSRQVERLFVRYCALAGVPRYKAHPHVLKHTIAIQSIKLAGIENVRQYLGHKSMSSTGAYLKVNDSDASAAVAGALRV